MIHLIVAFILTIILLTVCRNLCRYPSWGMFSWMLLIGATSGMFLDYFLGYRQGWWSYKYQTYWTIGYFYYLIPAWAMMVTLFILFYKLLEKTISNPTIRLTIYFGLIPLQQEFMGISQGSWSYTANPALIGIGWILLLDSCVIIKEAMDWIVRSDIEIKYYKPVEVTE